MKFGNFDSQTGARPCVIEQVTPCPGQAGVVCANTPKEQQDIKAEVISVAAHEGQLGVQVEVTGATAHDRHDQQGVRARGAGIAACQNMCPSSRRCPRAKLGTSFGGRTTQRALTSLSSLPKGGAGDRPSFPPVPHKVCPPSHLLRCQMPLPAWVMTGRQPTQSPLRMSQFPLKKLDVSFLPEDCDACVTCIPTFVQRSSITQSGRPQGLVVSRSNSTHVTQCMYFSQLCPPPFKDSGPFMVGMWHCRWKLACLHGKLRPCPSGWLVTSALCQTARELPSLPVEAFKAAWGTSTLPSAPSRPLQAGALACQFHTPESVTMSAVVLGNAQYDCIAHSDGRSTMEGPDQASGEHGVGFALQIYQMHDDDSEHEECGDPLWCESWMDLLPSSQVSQGVVVSSVGMSVSKHESQPIQSRFQDGSVLQASAIAAWPNFSAAAATAAKAGLGQQLQLQALQMPRQPRHGDANVSRWGESPCLKREKSFGSLPSKRMWDNLILTEEGVEDSSTLLGTGAKGTVGHSNEVGPAKDKKSCETPSKVAERCWAVTVSVTAKKEF